MAVAVPDKAARVIVILLGDGGAPDGAREPGRYVAAHALRARHRPGRHRPVETRQLGEERRRRRQRQARQVDVVVHVAHVVRERRDRVRRVQRLGLALRPSLLPPQAPDEQRQQHQDPRGDAQRQVKDELFLVLCKSNKSESASFQTSIALIAALKSSRQFLNNFKYDHHIASS